MPSNSFSLGIIGVGVMGEAVFSRLLSSGTYPVEEICLFHPRSERRRYLEQKYAVAVFPDTSQVSSCSTLILGIKPQQLRQVLPQLASFSTELVISMLAGVPLSTLAQAFPRSVVVRSMPNTPAQVGEGVTAFATFPETEALYRERVQRIFSTVGQVVEVPEKWMDAVTGLSGSGPGYISLVVEALTDGGVLMGLSRSVAQLLAIQTVLGTAKYLQETGLHPAQLKDRVTSPGGTTITGIQALERHGIRAAFIEAVQVSTLRSEMLGS